MANTPVSAKKTLSKKSKTKIMSLDKKSDSCKTAMSNPHEHTATYKKNKKTGEWDVKNPSGSIAYNYLYRGDYEEE
jgi:hypothetical protein